MTRTHSQDGVLLVNLGTPDAPQTPEVRRYLNQFLSDPRVIDLPAPARFMLVKGIILPFRSPRSAEAYRRIWTDEGSPLLLHSVALAEAVQEQMEQKVVLGMRYGRPSVQSALEQLRAAGCQRVVLFPLYPQYATSSTESVRDEFARALRAMNWQPEVLEVPPFFADPGFLDAFAERGRPALETQPDRVLFSFHGLPQSHVRAQDASGKHCLERPDCCDTLTVSSCYRAQCFATARGLAERLELAPESWEVSFQSRLSKRWIAPFSDERVEHYAREGVKRLVVFSPAFVADCLETLEEVGMGFRERFQELGGEELVLVPSLNSEPSWVRAVVALVRTQLESGAPAGATG